MTPKSRLVGKCPPTGIAHEWLLSCVDPMMALQCIELSKLLATLITAVWTLTCKIKHLQKSGDVLPMKCRSNLTESFGYTATLAEVVVLLNIFTPPNKSLNKMLPIGDYRKRIGLIS